MLVENLQTRVITVGVNLKPGVNNLNPKDTKIFMKEIETAERYAEEGIINFLDKDVTALDTDILDLSVKEALPLIKKTLDTLELDSLEKREIAGKSRNSILNAITEQLKLIRTDQKKDT